MIGMKAVCGCYYSHVVITRIIIVCSAVFVVFFKVKKKCAL